MMIPIGICSIVAMGFTIERALYLFLRYTPSDRFWDDVEDPLRRGDIDRAIEQAKMYDGDLADLVVSGLSVESRSPSHARDEMENYGMKAVPQLERFLPALDFIARVSPLLGLLGTVAGMIRTFSAIAQGGMGNPELLAGGISQALVTTASGLTVGILALFFHHVLSRRVDSILQDFEVAVRRIEDYFTNR